MLNEEQARIKKVLKELRGSGGGPQVDYFEEVDRELTRKDKELQKRSEQAFQKKRRAFRHHKLEYAESSSEY